MPIFSSGTVYKGGIIMKSSDFLLKFSADKIKSYYKIMEEINA
jgi:hypothetical protein